MLTLQIAQALIGTSRDKGRPVRLRHLKKFHPRAAYFEPPNKHPLSNVTIYRKREHIDGGDNQWRRKKSVLVRGMYTVT